MTKTKCKYFWKENTIEINEHLTSISDVIYSKIEYYDFFNLIK